MYAARQLDVSFSFTGHANDLFQEATLLPQKLREACFVACISDWHRNFYREVNPGMGPDRLPVIRCGVNKDIIRGSETRENGLILCVARLVRKKGIHTLIRALSKVDRLGWCCEVIGDGPERASLERSAAELGIADRVRLLGSLPNDRVRERLGAAELFVLPCQRDDDGDADGIPVVLMEAMASGVPVIAGDLPSIRELVCDGRTGLLIPGADPDACAAAIVRLLDDPAERDRLAEAGAARVREEFTLQMNARRLADRFDRFREARGA